MNRQVSFNDGVFVGTTSDAQIELSKWNREKRKEETIEIRWEDADLVCRWIQEMKIMCRDHLAELEACHQATE